MNEQHPAVIRLYVAGPWARREYCQKLRDHLFIAGLQVQARWLTDTDQVLGDYKHYPTYAERALDDIRLSTGFVGVNFTNLSIPSSSGGRHVELGYALARSMPIFLYGDPPASIVFHHLPSIHRVPWAESLADAIKAHWQEFL